MFSDISEIPKKVDLAVIAVRAKAVSDVLQERIRNGVGGATIISGGLAEVDPQGYAGPPGGHRTGGKFSLHRSQLLGDLRAF